MAHGIRVTNTTGQVQIDQDYFNLTRVSRTTLSSISSSSFGFTYLGGNSGFNYSGVWFVVDYSGINPVLAVTVPSGRAMYHLHYYNETNTGNPPPSGHFRKIFFCTGTTVASIEAVVFDRVNPSGILNTGHGIQVFNSSGALVYHSSAPIMKIIQNLNLTSSLVNTTISVPSGRKYAHIYGNPLKGYYKTSGVSSPRSIGLTLNSAGTTLTITDIVGLNIDLNAGGAFFTPTLQEFPGPLMLVDITNS
jgi:hypothetical protein